MSQCPLFAAVWFVCRARIQYVPLKCGTCLKPAMRVYCSEWCELLDNEWLHLRLYPAGDDFESIGAALGITARQARRDYRSAMRKLRRGLRRIGITDADVVGMLAGMGN